MTGERSQMLPSGVVCLLFTDVEGSTRLWAEDADAMSASLRVHDDTLRAAFESRGGYVFTTAGDSFAVAFSEASTAVDAAVAAQSALAATSWPGPELRVRMGLHLGETEERGGDYFGPTVNTCARIESAGHGGQILLSGAVRSVVDRDDLSEMGSHRLRDVPDDIHLFQVGDRSFPALRGLVGVRDTLPTRRTRLLGRERELAEVAPLLRDERLVTLVGPGGIGKTSIAVEVAGQVSAGFPGGAHFVDLAPVNDADSILPAFCRSIRLTVTGDPYDRLRELLDEHPTLLVVDNCEHVIDDAAALVDRLLDDVPTLHVLATSREHLDLDGERLVRIDPLPSTPDSPAVRLFVERAVSVSPQFAPDADDLVRISAICERLDGIPLAIELAAGRARSMGLADIERALDDRFTLLAGGRRGKLRRQQTLRAAIDWSIDLLDDDERILLARVAVVTGDFAIDIAAAVDERSPSTAALILDSLNAKSLVQRAADVDGEARYRLLETVREWGLEQLLDRGDLGKTRDFHAQWYLATAEVSHPVQFFANMSYTSSPQPVVDAMRAAEHLRTTDITGAAIILTHYGRGLVENGFGTPAKEIYREAKATGWSRLPCRLWFGEHLIIMDLGEDIPFWDPPPPDDGTFEWRMVVGGPEHDFGGLAGWYLTWLTPADVVAGVGALPLVDDDPESLAIRSTAMSNACVAAAQLGLFRESLVAYEEASALWRRVGGKHGAGVGPDLSAALTAAVVLDVDVRGSAAADASEYGEGNQTSLYHGARAVSHNAPADRPVAVARAAQDHCTGRFPGDESYYLAILAYYASRDGDLERAGMLVADLMPRSPGTLPLMRLTTLLANGEPTELMADQEHHQAFLAGIGAKSAEDRRADIAPNRRKLYAEVTRILD